MICFPPQVNGSMAEDYSGPLLRINYFDYIECDLFSRLVFALVLVVLLLFLKTTADEYLTASLDVVCRLLEMSQDVAGSTLLAFGNGAPDVFSTLAAFTKGSASNNELGLSAMLGSSSFVLTLVLGAVILLCKDDFVQTSWETFGRDVLFVVLALFLLLLLHVSGLGATFWIGLLFLALYATYVHQVISHSKVMYLRQQQQQQKQTGEINTPDHNFDDDDNDEEEDAPLVGFRENFDWMENHFVKPTLPDAAIPPPKPTSSTTPVVLSRFAIGLYWKQVRIQNEVKRFGDRTFTELVETNLVFRFFRLLSLPLEVLRLLTIPIPDPLHWNRLLMIAHPVCIFLFLSHILALPHLVSIVFLPLVALVLTGYAVFFLHDSKPPQQRFLQLGFAWLSFLMCVLWIYVLAEEIVSLFSAFGRVLNANSSLMGLSLLAWGNSIGDLVTNISISRAGLSSMAVSACVAGPVFNLLFGFGLSLFAASLTYYPEPVPIVLDEFTLPVVLLVMGQLGLTLFVARCFAFRLHKWMGIFLVLFYATLLISGAWTLMM